MSYFKDLAPAAAIDGYLYQIIPASCSGDTENRHIKPSRSTVAFQLAERKIACRSELIVMPYSFHFNENDRISVKGNDVQFSAFQSEIPGQNSVIFEFKQSDCRIFSEPADFQMGFALWIPDYHEYNMAKRFLPSRSNLQTAENPFSVP